MFYFLPALNGLGIGIAILLFLGFWSKYDLYDFFSFYCLEQGGQQQERKGKPSTAAHTAIQHSFLFPLPFVLSAYTLAKQPDCFFSFATSLVDKRRSVCMDGGRKKVGPTGNHGQWMDGYDVPPNKAYIKHQMGLVQE